MYHQFLSFSKMFDHGKKITVIGGGNVAVDTEFKLKDIGGE